MRKIFYQRSSIREYQEKEVPDSLIQELLNAAIQAPSAHNRQPWRFVLLTDFKKKETLAKALGEKLKRDRTQDQDPQELIKKDLARSFTRITTAPVAILVCATTIEMDFYPDTQRSNAEYLMAVQSTAMAAQNLLLMAHCLKLGACWMCAPLFAQEICIEVLKIPSDWKAQALITIGFPKNKGKPKIRKKLEEVCR